MADSKTRARIVEAADLLFYQKGYEATSFTDIATEVAISRGNFYYHFRTKDEILEAVINQRLHKTQTMLDQWEAQGQTPADRIRCFIKILIMNRTKIKNYGCPVGTLCSELAKLDHAAQSHATELFTLFRRWLRKQFEQLNCTADADALAMHLLARSQGIATLASAFKDETFISQEVQQLEVWLASVTS